MAASNPTNDINIVIHEDIIIHLILPKLPPKSLIRFHCVSKLWKSIISNPNFQISLKYRTQALFIVSQGYSTSTTYKVLKNTDILNPLGLEEPPSPLPAADVFWGSCNGLVLFSLECDIFLWNPATSYCQKVLELDFICNREFYGIVTGFCYDASNDDYVVLACFTQWSLGWNTPFISSTLKSKRWKLVSFPYFYDINSITKRPIVNNNRLHWLASLKYGSSDIFGKTKGIIYYDVSSNGFKELPSPDPIEEGWDDKVVGLEVLNDCLCMMRIKKGGDVEVLIMKEYGVEESWTTMFCIPKEFNYLGMTLLYCSWKVDIIFFEYFWKIHAYYPSTRTMEKVKLVSGATEIQLEHCNRVRVIPYVETHVSPTGYYWNEESDKKMASTEELPMMWVVEQ